jgi:hypothetical protein
LNCGKEEKEKEISQISRGYNGYQYN